MKIRHALSVAKAPRFRIPMDRDRGRQVRFITRDFQRASPTEIRLMTLMVRRDSLIGRRASAVYRKKTSWLKRKITKIKIKH